MSGVSTWPASSAAALQTSTVTNTNNESVPSVSTSDGTNESETGLDEDGNDAEGVWSPDIEQSFLEALAIYPPCGRRKIILSDEGKMYGRNELIARYIKLRTGKTRSRKQVSSHIQVLARRKSKDIQTQLKSCPNAITKERALQSLSSMSSSQIVSASSMRGPAPSFHPAGPGIQATGFMQTGGMTSPRWPLPIATVQPHLQALPSGLQDIKPAMGLTSPPTSVSTAHRAPAWEGRSIAGPKLRLKQFLAFLSQQPQQQQQQQQETDNTKDHIFVELGIPSYDDPLLEVVDIKQIYDKFPNSKGGLQDLYERGPNGAFYLVKFWADININVTEDTPGAFYAVNMLYESDEQMSISCSSKVCSFGRQVVEKVETDHARYENGKFVYRFHRSPMCDYMVTFIHKLKQLPEKYMMNSVLENFTMLQVVQDRNTMETLLCIAFVFEISASESGCQHSIYRLVKD